MPIVGIFIGDKDISLFTILYGTTILVMFFKLYKEKKLRISGNEKKLFIVWFGIAIVASFGGALWFYNSSLWSEAALSYLPKTISYLIFLILYSLIDEEKEKCLLRGFLYGCISNVIFAVIDGLGFYLTGESIANNLFQKYILVNKIRYNSLSLPLGNGSIRVGGFNGDPAHLGMIAPIVCFWGLKKRNIMFIILSVVSIFMSQSTTALVVVMIGIILNFNYFFGIKKVKISKKRSDIFIIVAIIISAVFICILNYNEILKILETINLALVNFFNRVNTGYISSDHGSDIRIKYLIGFLPAIYFSGVKILTGTGFGTASYPYMKVLDQTLTPYDPEMTYISYFFDTGIFGFFIYILILARLYKFYKKFRSEEDQILYFGIISLIFSGLFYHYTLFACQVLLLIVGVVRKDRLLNVSVPKATEE